MGGENVSKSDDVILVRSLIKRLFSIVSYWCLKCESARRGYQPGEGTSRGLLRDCTTLPINRFAALFIIFTRSGVAVVEKIMVCVV